jgi:uncharacterized membrane protein YagU involved in acid resistance
MTHLPFAFSRIEPILLWSLIGTMALTTILAGSQGLGLSRLSLPYLLGTVFSGNRRQATALGALLYMLGGFVFGFIYFLVMMHLGLVNWWIGTLFGALHGLFLLTAVLPVLPHLHPRMATEYDGPSGQRRLEPPGFLGLNYGYRTPLTTLFGHAVYGAIVGAGFSTAVGG